MESSPAALTPFQIAVAALFFSLPESEGFLLAGGAALAAQHLITRPTQDLDLFTRAGHSTVAVARDAFENAATERGWSIQRIRDSETFCRLMVTGNDDLLVDLALDSAPNQPPAASIAGPTFGLEELAGRKLLALFDRAEARDFADVFVLAQRYRVDLILERAAQIDTGFEPTILATMLGSLTRFDDSDIPVPDHTVAELRRFFHQWRQQLLAEPSSSDPP
ncbi:MAG: nucleotidyl transferase AbiEii/AbiGii toxin family protein [Actinomycetia bacterium]|nr:nucleotidyl transferase AbiEii/AbiGii toxin family protein [Actinomycetes bacterium]